MKRILIAAAVAISAATAQAATRPIVVELFTSQGCSSCPPADAVLAELATRRDILALGFHVDYWNGLGWKDPFSSPGSTRRQHEYATLLGRNEVYTPQMVVDGTREMVGSNRAAVFAAIQLPPPDAVAPVEFAPDRKSFTIGAGSGAGRVILVRFVRSRSTPIARGENSGRTLTDVNGVENLTLLGDWTGAPLRFDVAPPDEERGLAVLVQAADGKILGAAAVNDRDGRS